MKKLFKLGVTFLSMVLGGCAAGTKVVGSITCGDAHVDVMSIKNERSSLNGQTWSSGITFEGVTLRVSKSWYPGFLPKEFAREITGNKDPNWGYAVHSPHSDGYQFYMGEFPANTRAKLTRCLIDNDLELRSLLKRTKALQKFPPPGDGEFTTRFIFWEGKQKDLELRFDAEEATHGEYLKLSETGAIYYHTAVKMLAVGQLGWDDDGKLVNVGIDIKERRKVVPSQTDPKKFKRAGKTIAEFFSVPFVGWKPL